MNSVIFPLEESEAVRAWAAPWATGTWTPPPQEIAKLEAQLVPFLQSANDPRFSVDPPIWERLDEYNVQYLGFDEGDRKVIYANFVCALMANDNWTEDFYAIDDGGDSLDQLDG